MARRERTPLGIDVAVGASIVAAALVSDPWGRLVIVALAVGGYAALVDDVRACLATAAPGYLLFDLFDGFLVNRLGELTWDGTTSMWHLVVFALTVGLGLGHAYTTESHGA